MKKEGDVLLHMEVNDDDFILNIEGRSHDFIAALLYACRQEPSLIRLLISTVKVLNDEEFQNKSNEFFKTQGDA
jgi:hypothetical protein